MVGASVLVVGTGGSRTARFVGFAVLLAIVVAETFAFEAVTGRPYLIWYAENASAVFLGTSIVAWAVDLDTHPRLVSSNPLVYLMETFAVAYWLPTHWVDVLSAGNETAGDVWDGLCSAVIGVGVIAVVFAWLLVIVPIQYFVYLVVGAPARCLLVMKERLVKAGSSNAAQLSAYSKPVTMTNALSAVVFWAAVTWLA